MTGVCREALRRIPGTADGTDLGLDPRDLYDMLELDRRTSCGEPAQRWKRATIVFAWAAVGVAIGYFAVGHLARPNAMIAA